MESVSQRIGAATSHHAIGGGPAARQVLGATEVQRFSVQLCQRGIAADQWKRSAAFEDERSKLQPLCPPRLTVLELLSTMRSPAKMHPLADAANGAPNAARVSNRAKRVGCSKGITIDDIVAPNRSHGKFSLHLFHPHWHLDLNCCFVLRHLAVEVVVLFLWGGSSAV